MCMVVANEDAKERAEQFLRELVILARLPENTQVIVHAGTFWDILPQAPRADLSIFGLQREPDLDFADTVVEKLNASCIFVRDAGDESALA